MCRLCGATLLRGFWWLTWPGGREPGGVGGGGSRGGWSS